MSVISSRFSSSAMTSNSEQRCSEMMREGDTDRGHLDLVSKLVTSDHERAGKRGNLLGRRCAHDARGRQRDRRVLDGSAFDLDDSGRMSDHQLESTISEWPPISHLCMEGSVVIGGPCSLRVGQHRFADMPEAHLLAVSKILDSRVLADTLASPGPEQESQGANKFVYFGFGHVITVASQGGRR